MLLDILFSKNVTFTKFRYKNSRTLIILFVLLFIFTKSLQKYCIGLILSHYYRKMISIFNVNNIVLNT